MHTGEPVFSGVDSHDQLFKIVRIVGSIPEWMIRKAEKRAKFFASGSNELSLPSQYSAEEEGGFLDLPPKRTLRDVIGVDTGGPSGRRNGEKGHSLGHYEVHSMLSFIFFSCL